jgi:hypothetical protein
LGRDDAVAEEFVDLYEILELPIEADRNLLRKRVNELYLDAQRNLDHRNFQTRVKYQELFEITLPQARYILLDEGRRDEYDRLVRAFRAAKSGEGGVPAPSSAMPAKPKGPVEPGIPGAAPEIDALPAAGVDPAQLAKEREELWSKWKTGLESAMAKEKDSDERPAGGAPRPSTGHSLAGEPSGGQTAARPGATSASAARAARPQTKVNFQFNENAQQQQTRPLTPEEEKEKLEREATEKRRDQHRREIMKDVLVNVALIWSSAGAAAVIVPGFIVLTVISNILYPSGKAALLPWLPKGGLWAAGLGGLIVGAVFLARSLSKKMRQKTVAELSRMTYEELITRTGKG